MRPYERPTLTKAGSFTKVTGLGGLDGDRDGEDRGPRAPGVPEQLGADREAHDQQDQRGGEREVQSGLLRGVCRWPSWGCACVSGAKL